MKSSNYGKLIRNAGSSCTVGNYDMDKREGNVVSKQRAVKGSCLSLLKQ